MRRALDPASSPAEAAKAAEAFVNSLRKRGVNGYDFIGQQRSSHQAQTEPSKDADGYQFYREGFGWGRGRGRWRKCADGSTYWEDEHGYKHGPPNPGSWRRNENGNSTAPPPPPPRPKPPPQPDDKWDFMRKAHAQAAADDAPPPPQQDGKWDFVRKAYDWANPKPAPAPVASYEQARVWVSIGTIVFGMLLAIVFQNVVPLVLCLFAVVRCYFSHDRTQQRS